MAGSRRIPARRSQAYSSWALPAVGAGSKVHKAEAPRSERRIDTAGVLVAPVPRESLESQLVDNIRSGRFASGISARQLEAVVRDAAREGREDGFREGFVKGELEGRSEGLAAGRVIIEDAARRMAALLGALQQPLAGQQEELREAMLELVSRIARGVVRAELRLQPETLREVITEALAALPLGAAHVRVRVAPEDLALLADYGGPGQDWSLVPDPALERGDCRIEASESTVDYSVSARFEELLAQLLGPRDTRGSSP